MVAWDVQTLRAIFLYICYMKRLILIAAFLSIAAIGTAQTISAPVSLRSASNRRFALDTTSGTTPKIQAYYANTTTATTAVPFAVIGAQDFISVGSLVTKVSGTLAGTAVLEGSYDGVTYYPIGSAFTITDVTSQKPNFNNVPHTYVKYRVVLTLSGGVASIASTAIWRKG